ncbi:unnamed protein product [Rotaria sp. Silwood1]|nr:unnamed protein product [Rotaria sp. Silwood1]CAF1575121.1 unnamed protein product [Rotaria sp. Silwood1]CAF3625538.1 unnamed protein product [Rotaria sp. Silwood1]CAF4586181.1 unnamed protein product [Rotaria sp. Silwood1]
MNVSSETIAYPINHHHNILNGTHSNMYTSASPTAVNNKIRAIQTRKSRITLQSYYDFTDIRPLNLSNVGGTSTNSSNLSPHKLLERSKDLRLGRITNRHNSRPSVLSSISNTNQHSLIWPSYNSPNGFMKQYQINSPTISSTTLGLPRNKSPNGHMPDIYQRLNRTQTITYPPLIEQLNSSMFIEPRHKSLPKTKSSIPKAYYQRTSKGKSSIPISHIPPLRISNKDYLKQSKNNINENIVHLYESEEDDENVPIIDEEFEEYIQKSTVKCADWLIKYVFDQKFNDNDE